VSDVPVHRVRRSRDGTRVVCTRIKCGEPFADLSTDPVSPPRAEWHSLEFRVGWRPGPDGVWRMDRRARRNLSAGHGPKLRRAPSPDTGLYVLPSGEVSSRRSRERHYTPSSELNRWMVFVRDLPVEVECPACGTRQIADVDLFAVS
jgi:hypothetical protein